VLLAVMLAFADASIVVLALPQIIDRLHTYIEHVAWVIVAYNLSLIAAAAAVVPFASRLRPRPALVAGLTVFGLASLAAGSADALPVLIVARCAQGAGGALLLCASVPLIAGTTGTRESALAGWAAAAAVGAAIGPAIGGILTQVFDWRAIFFAQAPVAALAAWSVSDVSRPASPPPGGTNRQETPPAGASPGWRRADWVRPAGASLALACVSAALIGALFLVTVLMIDVWLLSPLATAAVVSVIPAATVLTERAVRGRQSLLLTGGGAVILASGLAGLALVSHRQLDWVVVALALCGTGLGLTVPVLTRAALRRPGHLMRRAVRTVAAHDAGLVLGLLILTPVFVHSLNTAPRRVVRPIAEAVLTAPIPILLKLQIGVGLIAADRHSSPGRLPDIGPPFARAAQFASGGTAAHLAALRQRVQDLIERAATRSFRQPLLDCALFALLAIPAIALSRWRAPRPSLPPAPAAAA
jgi:MFS family permease